MESFSNTDSHRKWCNLPCDILLLISKKLHGKYDRQLSAVCTSWNSSIPKSTSKPHSNFPLEIPCPIIPPPETKKSVRSISNRFRFWVVERRVVLITPLKKDAETPTAWIAEVEETSHKKYALFNPVTGNRILPYCCNRDQNQSDGSPSPKYISLFDFCVSDITTAYTIMWVDMEACYHIHSCSPAELSEYLFIKKIITFHDDVKGIIALLALRVDGKLAYWRSGCEEWRIVHSLHSCKSNFVDIISFDGKFCAVNLRGRLVMIDPLTVKLIKLFPITYVRYDIATRDYIPGDDDIVATYLVQCEEQLYLVKIVDGYIPYFDLDDEYYDDIKVPYMICFVLAGKFWDLNKGFGPTKSHIFFMGNDVTYSLSAEQLGWPRGNFAYHGGVFDEYYQYWKKKELFVNMCSKESWTYISAEDYSGIYDCKFRCLKDFTECWSSFRGEDLRFVGTNIFWPPSGW